MIRLNDDEESDLRELVELAYQAVSRLNIVRENLWEKITQGGEAVVGQLISQHNELETFADNLFHAAERLDFE